MTGGRFRSEIFLMAILVLALFLRVSWVMSQSLVIENEGGEYATIAENLLEGNGYLGQGLTGKPQLIFPPLYPIAIALVAVFTGNTEIAGRIVSIIMGLVLVIAINRLGTHIYGARIGMTAAVLTALHPLLVRSSTQVQTETTYAALIMLAIFFSIRCIDSLTTKDFIFAGVTYALAYLTRQEAIMFVLMFPAYIVVTIWIKRGNLKGIASKVGVFFAIFIVIASPYIFYLYHHTGQLWFEGKSALNYRMGQMMMSGATWNEANYGIGDDLSEVGVYTGHVNDVIRSNSMSLTEFGAYLSRSIKLQPKQIINAIVNMKQFGGPFLFVLVVSGLLRSGWDSVRAIRELYLILTVCAISVSLLSVHWFLERYTYVFLPFLLLWGGKGIEEITMWASDTQRLTTANYQVMLRSVQGPVRLALIAGLVLVATWPNWHVSCDDFGGTPIGCANTKKAGLWLKEQDSRKKTIMDAGSAIPYYARAEYIALPVSTSSTAIGYIRKKSPDYVVLRGIMRDNRSYMEEWLEKGLPDSQASIVYEIGEKIEDKVKIYRWALN